MSIEFFLPSLANITDGLIAVMDPSVYDSNEWIVSWKSTAHSDQYASDQIRQTHING